MRDVTADPTRFLLSLAGKAPPDVIDFDRYAVVEWAARGAFLNLNPYLAADLEVPGGLHREDFYSPMWNEPNFQGKQYAIPLSTDDRALYLNDDLLIRAGFVNPDGTPRPPQNWEEVCGKKFQGTGVIMQNGAQLGAPSTLPAFGPFPVTGRRPVPGDVITLRFDRTLFRGRIASISRQGLVEIDFSKEQPRGTNALPSEIAAAPRVEVKIFDQHSYAVAMSRYDADGNPVVAGFSPLLGNSWLYFYGWQNGATFTSEDGKTCQLAQPEVEVALQYMVDCYDEQGGYEKMKAYTESQAATPLHPFLDGRIAMFIDAVGFLSTLTALRPEMAFTVAPAPLPAARLRAGFKPVTWAGGFAYAIPATAKRADDGWKLIRFLSSPRAIQLQTEVDAERARAAGGVYIPDLMVRKDMGAWARQTYLQNEPPVNARVRRAYDVFASLLPDAKFRPITPVGNKLWEAQSQAEDAAIAHTAGVHEASKPCALN